LNKNLYEEDFLALVSNRLKSDKTIVKSKYEYK